MTNDYMAINTLVLVEEVQQAEAIAEQLRNTGVAVQQSWVSTPADFSLSLQRDSFGMGILYIDDAETDVPASILRYPDTPFLAVVDRFRNRTAEALLEYGLTDVVGLSHPIRFKQVLRRLLNEARIRAENKILTLENESRSSMLQTLLQSTAEPVAFVHQGMHSYGNSAYRNLIGIASPTALEQTTLLDIVAGDDREMLAYRLNELESQPSGMAAVDTRLIDNNGSEIPVRLQFTRSWYDSESALQMIVSPQEELDPIALLDAFEGSETIQIDPMEIENRLSGALSSVEAASSDSRDEEEEAYEEDFDDTLLISTIAVTPDLSPTQQTVQPTTQQPSQQTIAATLPQTQPTMRVTSPDKPKPNQVTKPIPNPVPGMNLALQSNTITCLRSDGSERITLDTERDIRGIRGLESAIDLAALDTWLLDQAVEQARSDSDTGIFVYTTSPIAALKSVIEDFKPRLEYHQVARRSITLIINNIERQPTNGQFSSTDDIQDWRGLIDIAHAAGLGVCLRSTIPEDGFTGTFAHSANAGIDYVLFKQADKSALATSSGAAERSTLLKQCQQRSIRSIAEIESDQSISKAWALGFDCFVIQPQAY